MNFLTGLVNNIKEINSATLTGAVDIVIVEQEDGTFRSTPFHVRFGKIGVVWCDNKKLEVEVNGQEVEELAMTLDPRGKAFFKHWAENERPPYIIKFDDEEEIYTFFGPEGMIRRAPLRFGVGDRVKLIHDVPDIPNIPGTIVELCPK